MGEEEEEDKGKGVEKKLTGYEIKGRGSRGRRAAGKRDVVLLVFIKTMLEKFISQRYVV